MVVVVKIVEAGVKVVLVVAAVAAAAGGGEGLSDMEGETIMTQTYSTDFFFFSE